MTALKSIIFTALAASALCLPVVCISLFARPETQITALQAYCFILTCNMIRLLLQKRLAKNLSVLRKKALEGAFEDNLRIGRAAEFWRAQAHHIANQVGVSINYSWDGSEPKLPL